MAPRANEGAGSRGGADPLWSKAPLALLRYPGLFVSIGVGAILLALAASAFPLFISASESELVRARVDDPSYTRWAVGVTYRNGGVPLPGSERLGDAVERIERAFERLTASDPYLAPPARSALGRVIRVADAEVPDLTRETRLFTGEGVMSQIEIVEGAPGTGAMVPDLVADALELEPGDTIIVGSPDEGTTTLPVDGVFRSLYRGGASGWWRAWNDDLVLYCANCAPPPQPLILPPQVFLSVAARIGLDHAAYAWQAPVVGELTLEEAEDAERRAAEITRAMSASRLFSRCYQAFFCNLRNGPSFGSAIGEVVRDVHGRITAVEGPANLLRAAGILVALAVVAGAGAFAMATRRVEASLLFARGARPVAVGGRAALEAVIPSVAGAGIGVAAAFALVAWLGPRGAVAARASAEALGGGALSGVAAVVAIATVSTVSFLRRSEHHRTRFGALTGLPWELALVALGLLVLDRLRGGGALIVDEALGTRAPSVLLLVFPVLFLAGFVALAARTLVLALRWARGRGDPLPPASYLAVHRLAARPRLTMLMVTASGLCLGLFVQSQAMARSMSDTVEAKAGVYVGSDVEVRIDHVYETPASFALPFTRVVRDLQAGEFRPRVPFDLLAIDPATFARAAFWDRAFASEPLEALVGRLEGTRGRVPILLAGRSVSEPASITLDERTIPVEVVGRAIAFPGMTTLRPLVVVDQRHLLDAFEGAANPLNDPAASHALWIRGDTRDALAAIPDLPFVPGLVITIEEVKDIPYIAAVIDSFLVMNGLGLLAALLVFAAMLMYLQARQRAQVVSYGLSLRMGMRPTDHLAAIAAEVGAMLGVAYAAGTAVAIVAARLVVPLLDPLEGIPPEPITVVPTVPIALVAPMLLLGAAAGGWLTERRARSADLAQVMRLAD